MLTRATSFGDFAALVAGRFGLAAADVTREARLGEDLGLDSVELYTLWAVLADSGVEVPEAAVRSVRTVGQAFEMLGKYGRAA